MVAGNAGVTGTVHAGGNISGAADIAGQELKIQAGSTITGSSVFHGALSSAYGATFVNGVIARTGEFSSSVFINGALNVTGASSLVTATSLFSNTNIVATTDITGTEGILLGGGLAVRIHESNTQPALNISGGVFISSSDSPQPIQLQLGASAASCSLDSIPYFQFMGVDGGGLLQLYKLQVSGGMLQVNEV